MSPSQVFPTFVGPTPQKDGIPLGLFEFLSPYQQSPSTKVGNHRPALASLCANVPATPTKRPCNNVSTDDPPDTIGRFRFTRTPTSTGKRFLLDTFVTPQKDRHSAEADATPSSSMRHLQTPTFLRRDSARLNVLAEQNETKGSENPTRAAEPLFKKRRGFGRSLSAIIRDLKKNEDEEFADEMEAQRQMEMETHARTGLAQADQNLGLKDKNGSRDSQVLVQDSQPAMSLGPDGSNEPENSDESSPEADVSGQPRKPWKKKGMKRQTKRVNSEYSALPTSDTMCIHDFLVRPVASKPKPQPVVSLQHDKEDSSSAIVLESQLAAPRNKDSEDEDGHSDFAPRNIEVASQSRAHSKSTKLSGPSKDGRDTQSNSPKKSKRKVNPQAHANYRRLKIKSKNGKGQGRGRFGRGHR